MAVHVKRKAERRPCRDSEVTESQFPVDKVKTFTLIKFQESLPGCFSVPGLISIAGFRCREDVYQAFCYACLGKDLLDTVIFTESMKFTDDFNFNPVFLCG